MLRLVDVGIVLIEGEISVEKLPGQTLVIIGIDFLIDCVIELHTVESVSSTIVLLLFAEVIFLTVG